MAAPDLGELLEGAAPSPTTALDIASIGRRAHRRRHRRRGARATASVLVVGLLIGVVALLSGPGQRHTVVAGPPSERAIPLVVGPDATALPVDLLDGTRLNLVLPESVARGLTGITFADLALHGSVYAEPGIQRGWAIDVVDGPIDKVVPGGKPHSVPATSKASVAKVDRSGHRLGLQFGSWTLVASGDAFTSGDIDRLLAGLALIETPDGFVEYRGSLPLWVVDSPDAVLTGRDVAVSVFLRECSYPAGQSTAAGLSFERIARSSDSSETELCDRSKRIEISLHSATPLTDQELDQVRIDLSSVGPTLAAVQAGQHP